ncbi:MAG: hypothetical protein ACYC3S_16435 [Chloroflexota bacterium]
MNTYDKGSREQIDPAAGTEGQTYTPAQRFFMARIERLVRLREEYEAMLRPDDWESKLLTKATYSTYCDCVQLGVGAEARENLAKKSTRAG